MIDRNDTLGDLVTANPARARTLEALGLDYCCGGGRTLAEACRTAGRDVDDAIAALEETDAASAPVDHRWDELSIGDLARHIESTHHTYLRAEAPRLVALGRKVRDVHGDRHPELHQVTATLEALWDELVPHLDREEAELFPACQALDARSATDHPGLADLRDDHETAGALLDDLRAHTGDFTVPTDGCASYRAFYEGLAQLDADTRLHVHKENNVLFPAIDRRLATAG